MLSLLSRLGGVAPGDSRLLLDEEPEDFLRALAEVEAQARVARARGERTELILYYSGHAKDGALRMGEGVLELEALKRRLEARPWTSASPSWMRAARARSPGRRAPGARPPSPSTRAGPDRPGARPAHLELGGRGLPGVGSAGR
ncbi:hypothetical protein ACN28S_35450 [Cystobacter fuscus]